MAYKTILVHVDESSQLEKRVEVAIRIALHEQAALVAVAATGRSGDGGDDAGRQRANAVLAQAEALAHAAGLFAFQKRLAEGDAAQAICAEALYADLIVLGQPVAGEQLPASTVDFLEYVTINCACPVLIVPAVGRIFSIGDRVLIGWNASLPASRAIRSAMPFLEQAKKVQLAVITAADVPEQGADPSTARISAFLTGHGIKVQLMRRTMQGDAGSALLVLASDLTSDLIVMGCAAHPRGRRLLLGGATRIILETATVPVLMAH